jgi:peptide/nickel transport system ATP-binding protein
MLVSDRGGKVMAGSGTAHMRNTVDAVLTVRDLTVEFRVAKDKIVKAVSGLSFDVIKGETLAIVGESGCGKTTLARAVLQLPPPNSGEVVFDKTDLTLLPKENLRSARTSMQMIFQDPISSLDPRMTVHQLIDEPLEIWDRGTRAERDERINNLLNNVGLEPELVLNRRSYEFSGGQCQRISIARALALDPRMLICDEPVSALDVSIQAQILNLLQDMKDRFGLTMIFISHDLAVVKAVSNRVMVMYLGKICEVATPDTLYSKPAHHYTKALLNSVPIADPTRQRKTELLQGEPPSPMNPPSGCRFRTRCAAASALCAEQEPQLREVTPGQFVACHHPIV